MRETTTCRVENLVALARETTCVGLPTEQAAIEWFSPQVAKVLDALEQLTKGETVSVLVVALDAALELFADEVDDGQSSAAS